MKYYMTLYYKAENLLNLAFGKKATSIHSFFVFFKRKCYEIVKICHHTLNSGCSSRICNMVRMKIGKQPFHIFYIKVYDAV